MKRALISILLSCALTSEAMSQVIFPQKDISGVLSNLEAEHGGKAPLGALSSGDLMGFRLGMNVNEFQQRAQDLAESSETQWPDYYDSDFKVTVVTTLADGTELEQKLNARFCAGYVCRISLDYDDGWRREFLDQARSAYIEKYGPFLSVADVKSAVEDGITSYVRDNGIIEQWTGLYNEYRAEAEGNLREIERRETIAADLLSREGKALVRPIRDYLRNLTSEYERDVARYSDYKIGSRQDFRFPVASGGTFTLQELTCDDILSPAYSYALCDDRHPRVLLSFHREGDARSRKAGGNIILIDSSPETPEYLMVTESTRLVLLHSKKVMDLINIELDNALQNNAEDLSNQLSI